MHYVLILHFISMHLYLRLLQS